MRYGSHGSTTTSSFSGTGAAPGAGDERDDYDPEGWGPRYGYLGALVAHAPLPDTWPPQPFDLLQTVKRKSPKNRRQEAR